MRSLGIAGVGVALIAHLPGAAGAQTVHALVRTAEGTQPVVTAVAVSGRLFTALGVAPGPDGQRVGEVRLSGPGGTATTPASLAVGEQAGAVTFSAPRDGPELELTVPGTTLRARGRVVRLVRDRAGRPLRAEAVTGAR